MNSAAGSFGLSFGLAFAGAIMLATLATSFTRSAEASDVLSADQQQQVAEVLEDDAQLMSNTGLEELLADQPEPIRDEIIRINTETRPLALQVALVIPVVAGLLGLANRSACHGCPTRPRPARPKAPCWADRGAGDVGRGGRGLGGRATGAALCWRGQRILTALAAVRRSADRPAGPRDVDDPQLMSGPHRRLAVGDVELPDPADPGADGVRETDRLWRSALSSPHQPAREHLDVVVERRHGVHRCVPGAGA